MKINRRRFMQGAVMLGAATTGVPSVLANSEKPKFRTQMLKSLIAEYADDATCEKLTKAGFFGVELRKRDATIEEARTARRTAEKHGVKLHSLMYGWAQFNHHDPAARRASIEDVKRSLGVAAEYGASTMLLVPCRINPVLRDGPTIPMPTPQQVKLDYDPDTLLLKSAADPGAGSFKEYVEAHNQATIMSQSAIEELIPVAAREGVVIGIENVGNNLWLHPEIAAAHMRSFNSPWFRYYFDLGNHTRYMRAEKWLRELGSDIVKLHIKDFKIDYSKPRFGDFVPIGKGDIDWLSVRKVIDEVNYNGWISIESSGYTDAEHSALMDRFFAGEKI